jgi:hypothetical protein
LHPSGVQVATQIVSVVRLNRVFARSARRRECIFGFLGRPVPSSRGHRWEFGVRGRPIPSSRGAVGLACVSSFRRHGLEGLILEFWK